MYQHIMLTSYKQNGGLIERKMSEDSCTFRCTFRRCAMYKRKGGKMSCKRVAVATVMQHLDLTRYMRNGHGWPQVRGKYSKVMHMLENKWQGFTKEFSYPSQCMLSKIKAGSVTDPNSLVCRPLVLQQKVVNFVWQFHVSEIDKRNGHQYTTQ